MRKSRNRPRRGRAPLGFSIAIFVLTALGAGYQALASFVAQQPGIAESVRQHLIASPFAAIHAATFSFPRPIGSDIPDPDGLRGQESLPEPKNLPDPKKHGSKSYRWPDPQAADITGSIPDRTVLDRWILSDPELPVDQSLDRAIGWSWAMSNKSDQLVHDEPVSKSQALAKGDRLVPSAANSSHRSCGAGAWSRPRPRRPKPLIAPSAPN
jgi:hypothetical protein